MSAPIRHRRDAAHDPRRLPAFPHAALAALVVALAIVALSGFTLVPAPVAADAANAAHPDALCWGGVRMHERVLPRATDAWALCFRRNLAVARVEIRDDAHADDAHADDARGDAASALRCTVRDPAGRVVAEDAEGRGGCRLRWRVRATGDHRIEVRNVGDAAVAYELVTR